MNILFVSNITSIKIKTSGADNCICITIKFLDDKYTQNNTYILKIFRVFLNTNARDLAQIENAI